MKKLILTLSLLFICANSYTQATLSWSRDFEVGIDNYYSEAPVIETDNLSIKVIGRKNTNDGQKLEIVVYNLLGEMITATSFGNDISNSKIIDFKIDSNNKLYLLISELVSFNKTRIVFQKYSLDGSLIWAAQIQDTSPISYRPCSIGLTNVNCIFLNAYKETNYPLFPTDADTTITVPSLYAFNQDGGLLWQREFNNAEVDQYFADKMIVYNDTAFLLSYNYNLIKVDSNNNLTQGNTIGLYDGIHNTQLTNDNNLLFTATTGRFRITKTNINGASFWLREYYTFLPSNVLGDEIKSVIQDSEGNIYVTGRHYGHNYNTPTSTNADILTLKYSPSGNLLWENRYQYGINNADIGNFITLKNGYLYIGGESQRLGISTDYDFVTLKINATTGTTSQVYRYNGLENGNDTVSSICVLDNGNYAITGLSYINSKYNWTTQFFAGNLSIKNNLYTNNLEISPNPVSVGEFLSITGNQCSQYKLISSLGQIVQSGKLSETNNQKILIEKINPGIYLLQLENEMETTVKKVIIK